MSQPLQTDDLTTFRTRLFHRHRWVPFVLPMLAFLVFTTWEPKANLGKNRGTVPGSESVATPRKPLESPAETERGLPQLTYPIVYTMKVVATLIMIGFAVPVYRAVPWRLHWAAVPVGVIGTVAWVGIAKVQLASRALVGMGLADWVNMGARPGFNPLSAFDQSTGQLAAFLGIRFLGLVLVVPLIEEFFLRGFLMRFVVRSDWWDVPLGQVTRLSAAIAAGYGVLTHPAEMLAAAIWFTGITILYARTRNLWDCVVAHAVTNLLLGVYVLVWHDWSLW